jgi:biopolymer transport protein ExbD
MRTRRRNGKRDQGIFEPNMTPLIDVSLVLVVILMVATPLAFQSGIAVNAASASGRAAAKANDARVELVIAADGTVRVNRAAVPRAALAGVLGPMLAESPTRLIIVRCEDAVPHGDFVSVLDEAKRLGASHIAVVGS